MLSDLLFIVIFLMLAMYSINRPYIALSAVIWVDIFKPQDISTSFLLGQPLSLIAAAIFFLSFFLNFPKLEKPALKSPVLLIIFFMIWITLANSMADFPDAAWNKYNWAIKVLLFSIFIPFVLNSKIKIEFFLVIMLISIGYFLFVAGLKGALSGGGYGIKLIDSAAENSGITESSTLSMVAVLSIPLSLYVFKFSFIAERFKLGSYYFLGLVFLALFTVIATHARTGLVCLALLVLIYVLYSKKRFRNILLIAIIGLSLVPLVPSEWVSRMDTLRNSSQDASAHGRVLVWRWTVDYANQNPFFGGGFRSHLANAGILHLYGESGEANIGGQQKGKAYHSIYFEVLGESGYGGLAIFMLIIVLSWRLNVNTMKSALPENWRFALAKSLNLALIIYCVGGAFIGVSFEPWLYYILMLSASIHNTVKAKA
jgi:putative inorganic carbon (HCO3(-)) transporter